MEISSNRILPYAPAQQPGRTAEAAPFKQQPQAEQDRNKAPGELLPTTPGVQQSDEAQLDYRQLVIQARLQQIEVKHQGETEGEAYRMNEDPLKVQQALGAYRGTAELQESGAELMPRLDDYV